MLHLFWLCRSIKFIEYPCKCMPVPYVFSSLNSVVLKAINNIYKCHCIIIKCRV